MMYKQAKDCSLDYLLNPSKTKSPDASFVSNLPLYHTIYGIQLMCISM